MNRSDCSGATVFRDEAYGDEGTDYTCEVRAAPVCSDDFSLSYIEMLACLR